MFDFMLSKTMRCPRLRAACVSAWTPCNIIDNTFISSFLLACLIRQARQPDLVSRLSSPKSAADSSQARAYAELKSNNQFSRLTGAMSICHGLLTTVSQKNGSIMRLMLRKRAVLICH